MFFKEQIKKRIKNEKGLTLVELLAVIVILAIIAAIAIPAIGNIINNSRDKAILSEALNVISGAKIAHMDKVCEPTGTSTCTNTNTDMSKYVEGIGKATYTVALDGNEYKITFSKFSDISTGGKFNGVADGITEAKLKQTLDEGKYTK